MTENILELFYEIIKESSSTRFVYSESLLNEQISRDRPYITEAEVTATVLGALVEYSPSGIIFHNTFLDIGELEAYLLNKNIIKIPNECIENINIKTLFLNLNRVSKIVSMVDFEREMTQKNGFFPFIYIEGLHEFDYSDERYEKYLIAVDTENSLSMSPMMTSDLKDRLFKYYETLGRYDIILKLMDIFINQCL